MAKHAIILLTQDARGELQETLEVVMKKLRNAIVKAIKEADRVRQ